MKFEKVPGFDGPMIIQQNEFEDSRGTFMETYKRSEFLNNGINTFSQDNLSRSSYGVLRGMHFQRPPDEQGKLVSVINGIIYDVIVDIRYGSPTYLKWFGMELSAENKKMLYVPPGFAHGFLSMWARTAVMYKCSSEYNSRSCAGIRWDDPAVNIVWPFTPEIISDADKAWPFIQSL